jgi:hypothetical protein
MTIALFKYCGLNVLIWLTVVKKKQVSLTPFMGFGFILAPGHKQGRDLVVRRLIILIFAGSTA